MKRATIKRDLVQLNISQQCELVQFSQSTFYYTLVEIAPDTLTILGDDERDRPGVQIYPFFGSRQIYAYGRARLIPLQHLHRTALTVTEAGGHLPRRNCLRLSGSARDQGLDNCQQHQTPSFCA